MTAKQREKYIEAFRYTLDYCQQAVAVPYYPELLLPCTKSDLQKAIEEEDSIDKDELLEQLDKFVSHNNAFGLLRYHRQVDRMNRGLEYNSQDVDLYNLYIKHITQGSNNPASESDNSASKNDRRSKLETLVLLDDPMLIVAIRLICVENTAGSSFFQRKLRTGYMRTDRILEELKRLGAIRRKEGSRHGYDVLIEDADAFLATLDFSVTDPWSKIPSGDAGRSELH